MIAHVSDRARWRDKPLAVRQRHAKQMCIEIRAKCPWVATDPFACMRIYNRLVNGIENPEGIGFKLNGPTYNLIHPDHVNTI